MKHIGTNVHSEYCYQTRDEHTSVVHTISEQLHAQVLHLLRLMKNA